MLVLSGVYPGIRGTRAVHLPGHWLGRPCSEPPPELDGETLDCAPASDPAVAMRSGSCAAAALGGLSLSACQPVRSGPTAAPDAHRRARCRSAEHDAAPPAVPPSAQRTRQDRPDRPLQRRLPQHRADHARRASPAPWPDHGSSQKSIDVVRADETPDVPTAMNNLHDLVERQHANCAHRLLQHDHGLRGAQLRPGPATGHGGRRRRRRSADRHPEESVPLPGRQLGHASSATRPAPGRPPISGAAPSP